MKQTVEFACTGSDALLVMLRGNQIQAVNSSEQTHIIPRFAGMPKPNTDFIRRVSAGNKFMAIWRTLFLFEYLFTFLSWPRHDFTWCLGLRSVDSTSEHKCTKIANFRENMFQTSFHECIAHPFCFIQPEAFDAHSVYQHENVCLLHSTHFAATFSLHYFHLAIFCFFRPINYDTLIG